MFDLTLRKDIGIDLGTASILVYVNGKGIVLSEPSVVAIDAESGELIEVGKKAQQMLGRTPGNIQAIRPLRDGVISQYDVTMKMLQHFIRIACGTIITPRRVVICVPSGVTEVEERAVVDAAKQVGAREAYLIEEPVAAAIGAGINIAAPDGNMVVDIGGGTTDIAVISLGGVVVSESIKVAGDKLDEAIMSYVRRKYNVLIGERTAETIKRRIGIVCRHDQERLMEVKGRSLSNGLPQAITLSSYEMLEAMLEPISAIIDAILYVIERTPPGLVADIMENGIVMTGGGSLLYGFDRLLTETTRMKARVAKDPIQCVAIGTGKSLENVDALEEGSINLARQRQKRQ